MNDETMQKLTHLWEDEEFVDAFANAKTEDEIIQLLSNNGVEITEEEVAKIKDFAGQQNELNEEELEDVAGGIATSLVLLTAATAIALGLYRQWLAWKRAHGK